MVRKSRATRRIVWFVLALGVILAVLGVVGTKLLGNRDKAVEVESVTARVRTITQVVTASGKVQPEIEVKISPDVSGEIIDLRVREGDQVAQGALLLRIKPDFYAAQVEQVQANVLQARANLAQRRADLLSAENELRRQQELFEKKVIAQSILEQAQAQHAVAEAGFEASGYAVQSSEARLREFQEQLSKTAIYAPMSGTVSRLNVELGERVVGTSQFAGTELMRIAQLDRMELDVDVNENDIVNVNAGDTASVEIDAYPERVFRGVVTEIANSARVQAAGTQEQVTNFPVKVRILDSHNSAMPAQSRSELPLDNAASFRPGMSGTVDIFTRTVFDVVSVPIQAVTVRDFNKLKKSASDTTAVAGADQDAGTEPAGEDLRKVVFVIDEDRARVVEIQTGISNDTHIEIVTGLNGGEQVVTGPYRILSRTLEPDALVRTKNGEQRRVPELAAQAQR
jgi:HlyD family secretion protein